MSESEYYRRHRSGLANYKILVNASTTAILYCISAPVFTIYSIPKKWKREILTSTDVHYRPLFPFSSILHFLRHRSTAIHDSSHFVSAAASSLACPLQLGLWCNSERCVRDLESSTTPLLFIKASLPGNPVAWQPSAASRRHHPGWGER